MPLKLGFMEDIVNTLETSPEVQSIGCLPYVFQHPERSYKPSSEIPSSGQMKSLQGQEHFFSQKMFLKSMILTEVVLLVVLGLLQMILGMLDVLREVSCIRHPALIYHNDINR